MQSPVKWELATRRVKLYNHSTKIDDPTLQEEMHCFLALQPNITVSMLSQATTTRALQTIAAAKADQLETEAAMRAPGQIYDLGPRRPG